MAVNIHNLIAAINPKVFCEPVIEDDDGQRVNLIDEVIKIAKEKGYLEAAKKAKSKDCSPIDFDEKMYYKSPFDLVCLKNPIERHSLVYDSFSQNLEPIYFWILDRLNTDYKSTDKIIDNFISSSGSGHFSEIGQKATRMQEEAMKMLGSANQVIKSILNIIYDLKEFEIRLDLYNKLKSKDENEKNAAFLSLKQVWIDTVDAAKKGNTSIKALTFGAQSQFVTLIDAFMKVKNLKEANEIDLNDRVKRILQQRVLEFDTWIVESERELRKRFEIEKTYLKSQVNTVHLYARWAKPYLRAARQLEQNASPTAALVTTFNTVLFELTLLGQGSYDPQDDVSKGDLPDIFKSSKVRKYVPLVVVELKFRSVPERAGQQGYGFRGRVEIVFTSYALNKEEIEILKKEVEKDDIGDVLKFIEGATDESLSQLKGDIDHYLDNDDKKNEKESKKDSSDDTNPFSALFSGFSSIFKKSDKKKDKEEKGKASPSGYVEIRPDSDTEKVVRSQALLKARADCDKLYSKYKKEHEMPTF